MLNREHALAADAAVMLRAIRAAFSAQPDPLLVDALSDSDGVDTREKVADQTLEAKMNEAADRNLQRFGLTSR